MVPFVAGSFVELSYVECVNLFDSILKLVGVKVNIKCEAFLVVKLCFSMSKTQSDPLIADGCALFDLFVNIHHLLYLYEDDYRLSQSFPLVTPFNFYGNSNTF